MAKSLPTPDSTTQATTEHPDAVPEKSKKKREESLAFRALEMSKEDSKKRKKKAKKAK